eukprot:86533-Pleurochrysis_carterae.AAC.1
MQIGPLRLHDDQARRRVGAAAHTWLLRRRPIHALHARRASFVVHGVCERAHAALERGRRRARLRSPQRGHLLRRHTLKQEKYIAYLVATYLPDGVPLTFQKSRTPASESLYGRCRPPVVLSVARRCAALLLDANAPG